MCTSSYGQTVRAVYLNDKDSTKNMYVIVYPTKQVWSSYLVLIPGMFQKPMDVLVQTELPKYAAQQGILTIIPTFKTGISSIGIDSASLASFVEILMHVASSHKLADKRFYLGGFSIGGTCALKYSELALSNNLQFKPAAIFAIDSPLDFERMYHAMLREKRLPNRSKDAEEEGDYMLKRFMTTFGGTPSNDTTQQAIKPLVNLPIRLYTEPDILWWLNDGADYSGLNSFDFAALTNELKRMGNTNISLIVTHNKGFRRPNNIKHPHSWSIAEPTDLVEWLLAQK
jgi:hypothetical protein